MSPKFLAIGTVVGAVIMFVWGAVMHTAVPFEQIEVALSVLDDEYGFLANGHHFAIVGECRNCREQPVVEHAASR